MIIGPKYKIAKRLGAGVFEKTQTQKFALSEARSAQNKKKSKRPSMMSDYKKQLIEKQKMRFLYGISEKQLSKYVKEAFAQSHQPISQLIGRLESRLDNVVYRLGLAKTRRLARQVVSHGHIWVNGRRLNIPSHRVKIGDVITVREQSRQSPLFVTLDEDLLTQTQPHWLSLNVKELKGEKKAEPTYVATETIFDPQQVLEYYSR
jgi:small subunit ribosomal protein S4